MYEVHWVKAYGCLGETYEDKQHGAFDTIEEAQQSVRDWWKKNDFRPNYIRQIAKKDGDVWWDYGLHRAFYVFRKIE